MKKVPVSERALFQRIQRKLKKDNKKLIKSRMGREKTDMGTYYMVDFYTNTVVNHHIENIEDLARDENVIAEYEYLTAEE